jgi:hypothetical protein
MKNRESAVTEALQRAKLFLLQYRERLEADHAEFARALQKLEEVLDSLMAFGVDQDTGYRGAAGETAKQRRLRLDLRTEWLKPIAAIARRNLRPVPEFDALQMPKASLRGQAFTASARGMAAAAAAHRDALVGYGLPETFVEDLGRAIDQFETSLADRESYRGRRTGATKGLETATKEARTVLSVLDALVRRWAKGDDVLLHGWASSRLIRRRPGPVSATSASATEATAPSERPIAIA